MICTGAYVESIVLSPPGHKTQDVDNVTAHTFMPAPPGRSTALEPSQTVVHLQFDRMRGHAQPRHFLHLQFDVGIDQIVVEPPAGLEKSPIPVEVIERHIERVANRRY